MQSEAPIMKPAWAESKTLKKKTLYFYQCPNFPSQKLISNSPKKTLIVYPKYFLF